jgi:cysteine synthase
MGQQGLERDLVDAAVYEGAVQRFRDAKIRMPTFAQLAQPGTIPSEIEARLSGVDPDAPDPLNLFRVHWYNEADRRTRASVPQHLVLPTSLTGVAAPIIIALGNRFPMIAAHKVLAAYSCLAPRIVTGQFDPVEQRAIWPSTGNYCRGGVAISRIMGCRGVAVLPEGMSQERFDWLDRWVADPSDIIRTPGTESNVKEIYDKCAELAQDSANVILNQFSEFGNHLGHYLVTGGALEAIVAARRQVQPDLEAAAFVSATGSAGTIGAGDWLKDRYGTKIVAVEALECPTLLENGFGEHNIQGIGDKHVPLIHNVTNTDLVVAISDVASDQVLAVFNTDAGRSYLTDRRGVPAALIAELGSLGISSICNVLAAIKTAKALDLGPDQAVVTIATDGAAMYMSELDKITARDYPDGFDGVAAAETFGRHVLGAGEDHLLELTRTDRDRIFNLGYFTWVEQQGIELAEFEARRAQTWWRDLRTLLPIWDEMIDEFNDRTGVSDPTAVSAAS